MSESESDDDDDLEHGSREGAKDFASISSLGLPSWIRMGATATVTEMRIIARYYSFVFWDGIGVDADLSWSGGGIAPWLLHTSTQTHTSFILLVLDKKISHTSNLAITLKDVGWSSIRDCGPPFWLSELRLTSLLFVPDLSS
jgi:hypothetical protein